MKRWRPTPGELSAEVGRTILSGLLALMLASGCSAVRVKQAGGEGGVSSVAGKPEELLVSAATGSEAIDPATVEPTVVAYHDYHDPLIRINRAIFAFNNVTYRYALIPLGKGYLRAVPEPVRQSIGNFFTNLKTPIYLVNHLIQLKGKPMVRSLQRFGINTTIGLLGLFDPAGNWYGLERAETDFEDTLIRYGAGYGAYLVLPVFGPSDIRNGLSLVVDQFLNPIPYLVDDPWANVIRGFDYFQEFAPEAEQYEIIRRESEDPYLFLRNLYLQGIQRDADY
jgi:phospholipid-binding lipoprotein MlaA